MKIVKAFDIETANARFTLVISAKTDGKGFVGEYSGTTPKFAQALRSGAPTPLMKDIGSGNLEGEEVGKLIAACRAEIEKIAGKIQITKERKA
jgi:hypothetical protein